VIGRCDPHLSAFRGDVLTTMRYTSRRLPLPYTTDIIIYQEALIAFESTPHWYTPTLTLSFTFDLSAPKPYHF